MRIGTWNLEGRWSGRHRALLEDQSCDVWLLTEIHDDVSLAGYQETRTTSEMATRRRWAGIFSTSDVVTLPDPHPATAAAETQALTFWSSVLPWRGCGGAPPWRGEGHEGWMASVVSDLVAARPSRSLVWGGDWNQSLVGREYVGSADGRRCIEQANVMLGLEAATADLPHRLIGLSSIDHIAVPAEWRVSHRERIRAEVNRARLSDHEAYVIEVTL